MAAVQPSHADSLAGQVSSSCYEQQRRRNVYFHPLVLHCRQSLTRLRGFLDQGSSLALNHGVPLEAVPTFVLHSRQPQQQPHICPTGASLVELAFCEDLLKVKLPWQVMISAFSLQHRL